MLYEGILKEGCHLALELAWRLSGGAGAHLGDAFRTLPVVLFEKPAPPPKARGSASTLKGCRG